MRHFAIAVVLGSFAWTGTALAQQPNSPPQNQQANSGQNDQDMQCRKQASQETGYRGPSNSQSSGSNTAEQQYGAAYYDCMNGNGGPPPSGGYGYGPGPGGYAYGPPPPPYYGYGPYPYGAPYPYPYYPPYFGYGPGVTFGFGFGGRGRWR